MHVTRLTPGRDLKMEIEKLARDNNILAGFVATCVGSLTKFNLRFANQRNVQTGAGFFEIISLSGTVSSNGCHLHMSISRENGEVIGGHLLEGCIVYTTAEIIIVETPGFVFYRENDGTTQWKELRVETDL